MLYKIYYNVKVNSANTTYLETSQDDMQYLLTKCIQMQSYMGELSLTKEKEVRDVYKWYTTSNKSLPYSNSMKKYNSPQSFISGVLNNLMFGTQRDIAEIQALHLENIINSYQQLTDCLNNDYKIKLQKDCNNDSIMFIENILSIK